MAPRGLDDWQPRYNIAPTTLVLVLWCWCDGARHLGRYRWGLVPTWNQKPEITHVTFNARAERI